MSDLRDIAISYERMDVSGEIQEFFRIQASLARE